MVQRPSKWVWCRVDEERRVDEEPERLPKWRTHARRWVGERTFAWVGRQRRMSKEYEYLTGMSEAFIYAAMVRLMLTRLSRTAAETG
jgi:transposase